MSEDGNREERCWKDGLLDGPATVEVASTRLCNICLLSITTIEGVNGDRLEFNYKEGVSTIFIETLDIYSAVENMIYH